MTFITQIKPMLSGCFIQRIYAFETTRKSDAYDATPNKDVEAFRKLQAEEKITRFLALWNDAIERLNSNFRHLYSYYDCLSKEERVQLLKQDSALAAVVTDLKTYGVQGLCFMDMESAVRAVKKDIGYLSFIPNEVELDDYQKIFKVALSSHPEAADSYFAGQLPTPRYPVLDAIAFNNLKDKEQFLKQHGEALKDNRDFWLDVVAQNFQNQVYLPASLKEFMNPFYLSLIEMDEKMYKHLPSKTRANKPFVIEAIVRNPNVLKFLKNEDIDAYYLKDLDVFLLSIRRVPQAFPFFDKKFTRSPLHVVQAVRAGLPVKYIPEDLLDHPDVKKALELRRPKAKEEKKRSS